MMSPNGDSRRMITAASRLLRRLKRAVPGRAAVRDAVLLAARGHDALIDERRGGGFRAVIIDRRRNREDLRVVAKLPGGRSVLVRR